MEPDHLTIRDIVNERSRRFKKDMENTKEMIEKGQLPWIIVAMCNKVNKIEKMLQEMKK